jgi:hypothetical protein
VKSYSIKSHEGLGGLNVGLPSLLWHSAQLGRQNCQLFEPAALYPQGNSLVLYAVRCWVDSREGMRTEGLGHLKISKDPTGNRGGDLPSCGSVSHQLHHCSARFLCRLPKDFMLVMQITKVLKNRPCFLINHHLNIDHLTLYNAKNWLQA